MIRKISILLLISFVSISAWSQSLEDNEYYRQMVELKARSEEAFEEGDYIEARRLAEESRSYKEQSDQWIETQLAAYRARAALVRVKDRLAQVSQWNAVVNFPEEYAEGQVLYDQAYGEFREEAYVSSLATSNRALEVLSVIAYLGGTALPARYEVRLLPGNTDCLWNIAGYEFIYGDPYMWKHIYDANRDSLVQKENPDLIHPALILDIPAIDGEVRSGTWKDGVIE